MSKKLPSRKGLEPITSLGETETNIIMPDDSKRAYLIIDYFENKARSSEQPSIQKIRELNEVKCRMGLLALEQMSAGIIPHTAGFWLQELKIRTAGPWSWQPWCEEIEQQCELLESTDPDFHRVVSKSLGLQDQQLGDDK